MVALREPRRTDARAPVETPRPRRRDEGDEGRRGLGHEAALDGLRGLAVAAVLAFHTGVWWAKGGFLGVSTFFTLSGFLITSLLVDERRRTGAVALGRFWSRRARRLLPAALLTIGGTVVAAWALGDSRLADLRGDALASVGYVANWHLIAVGGTYTGLFRAASPLQHLWSLAVEEQLYLVLPLVAVAAMGRGRRTANRRGRLAVVLGALLVGSTVALVLIGPSDGGRAYYGTDTRAAELLAGALLAALLARRAPLRLGTDGAPPRERSLATTSIASVVGPAALVGTIALWATASTTGDGLYRGGLTAATLASVALVLAAITGGPVQRLLRARPLAALGRISYGVYLYHWPVFTLLDAERAHLHGPPLVAVQLALTLAIAVTSYRFVEQPIRRGARLRGRRPWVVTPLALAAVAVVTVVATLAPPAPAIDIDSAAAEIAAANAAPPPIAPDAAPLRVAIFGDSTATMLSVGLRTWALDHQDFAFVGGDAKLGCPLARGGELRNETQDGQINPACDHWDVEWPATLAVHPADVAVVLFGPWDVSDRRLPNDTEFRHVGDPVYDAYVEQEIVTAANVLGQSVRTVVWVTSPDIDVRYTFQPPSPDASPTSDPARMARFNELVRQAAAVVPAMRVIDLNAYLRTLPGGAVDLAMRPDGVHLSGDASKQLAPFLVESIQAADRDHQQALAAHPPTVK